MGRSRTTPSVGLTIEPGRIAAAQVAVNGAIVIQDGGRAELEPGVVRDGEVADVDGLADALRSLWRDHGDLDKRVRIGVANARIVVRTLYLPPIDDAKQLATAVRFQAKDEIPMPLEDAVLDFHSVGTVDTPEGPRQRIVLVAARRDMIIDMLTAARAAGLKPTGIDLSAFGMVRALRREGDGSRPELFVSIGGLTNLAVSDGGVCGFTRVAGSGLESLAVDLAERRELTLEHARMWLHHVGLEAPLAEIEGDEKIVADARLVLSNGVRRIAAEVRGSLDFHQGQVEAGTGVERVVLTGPAVAVAGFAPALEAELGIEVQERVVSGSKGVTLDPLDAACLSVPAGLAIEQSPTA
ncbi:MAG TPA: pilus assembly protein PilM [Solirubrobacteraceae bacterium]|nr:pilus assembly protein PilM [Solirubrobacteraceae bacterium]